MEEIKIIEPISSLTINAKSKDTEALVEIANKLNEVINVVNAMNRLEIEFANMTENEKKENFAKNLNNLLGIS